MIIAAILFAAAIAGGVMMTVLRLRGRKRPPNWLALLHGIGAGAGLVVLLIAALGPGIPGWGRISLAVFLLTALGGFGLLSYHMRGRALPVSLIAVHGVVAVVAFVLLLLAIAAA